MSTGEKSKERLVSMDRRVFVQAGGLAAGGLVLGATLGCSEDAAKVAVPSSEPQTLNLYVQIAPDDTITLINPCAEMGQGVDTAMPQILADELEARWNQLRVVRAPLNAAYNNPGFGMPMQSTAGSTSVRYYFEPLRNAGAAARDMLVRAAAERWGVEVSACKAVAGTVKNLESGEELSYGALAEAAAQLDPPANPVLKEPSAFAFIGQSMPSPKLIENVGGENNYTVDVTVPGMLYAAVRQSPVFGGTLKGMAENEARAMPGVRAVVPMGDAVAVVADRWPQANLALEALSPQFEGGTTIGLNSQDMVAEYVSAAESELGADYKNAGEARQRIDAANMPSSGTFFMPFLAHMAMEPLSCTALVSEESCEIWTGTQNLTRSTSRVAEQLGLSADQVTIHTPNLGGSFGRRLGYDLEVRAAEISKAVGAPVKVIWSREEATAQDFYRPAVAASYRAVLGEGGQPDALELRIVAPRFMPGGPDQADPGVMNGLDEVPYDIPHVRYSHVQRSHGVPMGTWRSVQRSYAIFFIESIVDELAHEAGQDPYTYRRGLIKGQPRLVNVLDLVAEQSNWSAPTRDGIARGIAAWPCYGSYIAQVVELSVDDGDIRLHRVFNAVDCGRIINPNIVRQQIEGGLTQGLSATLNNEITLENGAVVQSNFQDYPHLMLHEMPEVGVHLVDSDEAPGGIGELATPAVQAALTNALFVATGKRIRTLPISHHDLSKA